MEHTFGTCVNLLKGKLSKEIRTSDPETLIITALRLICIKYVIYQCIMFFQKVNLLFIHVP
jgi:hypothetical protein